MRSRARSALVALAVAASTAASTRSSAADDGLAGRVIQERRYRRGHELRASIAYLPQDPFYKAAGPDLSYIWHRTESFSWEAVRIGVFAPFDSKIRRQIRDEFDVDDDPYEKARFFVGSHARFAPLYGRFTVMNRGLLHQEAYLVGGLGLIGWTGPEDGSNGGGVRPAIDVGLGFRWYASRRWSVKAEVLENLMRRSGGGVQDHVYLTIGLGFALPEKERKPFQERGSSAGLER